MNGKKYVDYRLIGVIGSALMIISEFLQWFSGLSLIQIYIIYSSVAIDVSFLYLFPLISGIICIGASGLMLYNDQYRLNSIIINFVGLSFMTLFFFELIPGQLNYLANAGIGFYFCLAGFLLVLLDILNILLSKE
ncbi:MAG: hypothetical protein EU548_04275 [Promethearchaeota archaeon]|nr:MAG: hypothetical protein EU548_04275 [Candidatus Lokiarchaeota archaeon]